MTKLNSQHATLVGEIYLGSQNSMVWNQALQTLADQVGAEFGFLIDFGLDGTERALVASTDAKHPGLSEYLDCWQQLTQQATLPRTGTTTVKLVVSDLLPQSPGHYRAGAIFGVGDERIASYCVTRAAKDGPFKPRDLTLLEAINPHLQRAMEIRASRLDGERSTNEIMDALQAHGWGVAAISVEGKVLSTNPCLKNLLSKSCDLALRRKALVFADDSMRSSYRELLQSLRSPAADSKRVINTPVKVRVGHGHSVRAVQTGSFGAEMWCLPLDTRAMLLFIPDTDGHTPEQELVDRYRCTPTEAEVAIAMSGGARLELIAKARSVKVSTIRSHVKRIYAKLGVNRQAELIMRLRRTRG